MNVTSFKSRGRSNRSISFRTVERTRLYEAVQKPRYNFTGGNTRVKPRQVASGTYKGYQQLGVPNFQFNSSDGNMIVKDDTTNRLLIGKQAGGF